MTKTTYGIESIMKTSLVEIISTAEVAKLKEDLSHGKPISIACLLKYKSTPRLDKTYEHLNFHIK